MLKRNEEEQERMVSIPFYEKENSNSSKATG
jgi:hypothetical protein